MAYTLPALPYALDALVPHIDAKTMEIHHGKHHQAYITNANNLLKDQPALESLDVNALIADLSKVPEAIRGGLRNNAGGHSNHAFFWTILGPGKGGAPKGTLAAAIDAELGGFAKLKEDFAKAGATRFGSGWAWLYVTADKKLADRLDRQPRQPAHGQGRRRHRRQTRHRPRRLGARLLPQLSEPPPRLHRRLLERRRLGCRRGQLRRRDEVSPPPFLQTKAALFSAAFLCLGGPTIGPTAGPAACAYCAHTLA